MGDQVLLHGGLGDRKTLVIKSVGVLATASRRLDTARVTSASRTWVGVASGIWGPRRPLGIRAGEAVAVGHTLPLVVAGSRDAKDPTGLGHVPLRRAWSNTAMRRW